MKKIIAGLCLMGATLGLTSCNDFLDMTPTDKISDKGYGPMSAQLNIL